MAHFCAKTSRCWNCSTAKSKNVGELNAPDAVFRRREWFNGDCAVEVYEFALGNPAYVRLYKIVL